MQFLGYEVTALMREYTFTVRESSNDPREFILSIPNEAFNERRVSYQDAPDVCSLKLRRELAAYANRPPETRYRITNEELEEYRSTHAPRTPRSPYARKPMEDY